VNNEFYFFVKKEINVTPVTDFGLFYIKFANYLKQKRNMGFFNLFGGGTSTSSIEEYLKKDAIVIDVRTPQEFFEGHVQGSKNIPLNIINSKIEEIKKMGKPIITCCRSGARSGSAASILQQHSIDTINGGPWGNVANCVK